jgi:hypothetical protein
MSRKKIECMEFAMLLEPTNPSIADGRAPPASKGIAQDACAAELQANEDSLNSMRFDTERLVA